MRPICSVSSRRRTKRMTRSDAQSTHCRSSTAIRSGPDIASLRKTLSVAVEAARASARPFVASRGRSATWSARRCGRGSSSSASSATSSRRSARAVNPRRVSASAARVTRTWKPRSRASSRQRDQMLVLPIPASPSTNSALGRSKTDSRNVNAVSSSASSATISPLAFGATRHKAYDGASNPRN